MFLWPALNQDRPPARPVQIVAYNEFWYEKGTLSHRTSVWSRPAALPCQYRVYTHINNTNPILLEHSPERAIVTRAGVIVGFDGLHLTL